jgi:hypothetical protein
MSDQEELDKISKIILANEDKNFVKRILDPLPYGSVKNKDGSTSTHRMRVDHLKIGDKEVPAMYPTIFWKDGEYIDFGDDIEGAKDYALKNKEYIPFDDLEEALWAEKNWKRLWGLPPRK